MVRHGARFTALQRSLLATAAKTRRRGGGRSELFPCRRVAHNSRKSRAFPRGCAQVSGSSDGQAHPQYGRNFISQSRPRRCGRGCAPHPDRFRRAASLHSPAVVGAEGDGRDGGGEDRGRRRGRRVRGRRARGRGALGGNGDALHVARVSVLPAWRGRGLAGSLIAACEEEAKRRRIERMTLKTRLEFPENGRLFERCGFARRDLQAHEGFDSQRRR